MANDKCIFCKIASGSIKAGIVYEDDHVIAFNDIKPLAPVHVVIIPKRHIGMLSDLEDGDAELFGRLAIAAKKIAKTKGIAACGYRIVANCGPDAGQEVFHIHIHLLGGRNFTWPPG